MAKGQKAVTLRGMSDRGKARTEHREGRVQGYHYNLIKNNPQIPDW